MEALRHASSAVRHAEALADEATDLGLAELAGTLRERAADIAARVERALEALDRVPDARADRQLAHGALQSLYDDVTSTIEGGLPRSQAARLLPAPHLDVAERARFRLRRLQAPRGDLESGVLHQLERGVAAYETVIDGYLLASARSRELSDDAVAGAQLLRIDLERAKRRLLTLAPVGSDAWRRIKRRAVRTKKPRWLLHEGGPRPLSSEGALTAQGRLDPGWERKKAA
jgi:hypothetical protein